MAEELKSPKSSLRNNIVIAFFLVIIIWGIAINSSFNYALRTTLSKEGLDKIVIEDIGKYFTNLGTGLTIAGIVIVLFIAVLLSRTITKPLKKLTDGTMDIARGKWDTRIDIVSRDELGQLAEGFNFMAEQIEEALQKIKLTKEYTENIVATTPSILIVLNNRLYVLFSNRAFEKLKEQFPSLTFEHFITPLRNDIRENQESGETLNREIVLTPERSETSLIFSAVVSKIGNAEEEEKACILLTITDITVRKKMEKELKNRVDELEKFYDMAVGRELRIKELKKEIKELKTELSQYKKHDRKDGLN